MPERLSPLEQTVLSEIDADRMWRTLEYLNTVDRTSGTEGEFEAVAWLCKELEAMGIAVTVEEFENYLSFPVRAWLRVTAPEERMIPVKTRAFTRSTPPQGIDGELVYVPKKITLEGVVDDEDLVPSAPDYEGLDVKGKIVLAERGGPDAVKAAQDAGAIAHIHLWGTDEDALHEMIVTPVWGTPTPETAADIPAIPAVSMRRRDGLYLRDLCLQGKQPHLRLGACSETKWRKQLLPVVHIQGRNPDQFVLVAGHLDSWHVGITDNGTGNAACLELARVLHQHRDQLERGVKIAWWPGHSTGRYAGSTWYCDNHWEELNRGCVAYLNIDSPGSRGATWYGSQNGSAELAALGQGVIRDLTGQEADFQRPLRAGDQSFFGPGVPSLYCLLGNMPNPAENWYAVGGSGMNWWWHTEYDTLDTADRNVLATDTQIYALTVLRLCNAVVLPIQTERCAAEITRALESLPGTVDVHKPLIEQARTVQALCAELDERAAAAAADGSMTPAQAEQVNQAILGVLRHLIPVNYTSVGPFHHDPATPRPVVPAMDGVRRLAELQPGTDEYGFLRTSLVRNRNWVSYTLRQAADCARAGLMALGREVTAHV